MSLLEANSVLRKRSICQMPRGRGRRRTSSQSSSSMPKTSCARGRSVSRAESRASDGPRRRSPRISSLAATREESASGWPGAQTSQEATNPPRAECLRLRAVGAETARQRQRQQNRAGLVAEGAGDSDQELQTRQTPPNSMQNGLQERLSSPQINGANEQSVGLYEMEVVVEPPAESRPGAALYPLIVVRVRRREGVNDAPDLSELWASVFVTCENGFEVLAPPRTDLLTGTLVNSVHQVFEEEGETGYVSFPGLTIRQPGSYRIRICLIRMEASRGSTNASFESGVNFQTAHSRVVRIHAAASAIEPCKS